MQPGRDPQLQFVRMLNRMDNTPRHTARFSYLVSQIHQPPTVLNEKIQASNIRPAPTSQPGGATQTHRIQLCEMPVVDIAIRHSVDHHSKTRTGQNQTHVAGYENFQQ